MSEIADSTDFLAEIDLQQDNLLRELDDLNLRVESAVKEQTARHRAPESSE